MLINFRCQIELKNNTSNEEAIHLALTSGDDYELCFTIPPQKQTECEEIFSSLNCRCTCIGKITAPKKLDLQYQDGKKYEKSIQGYQHF